MLLTRSLQQGSHDAGGIAALLLSKIAVVIVTKYNGEVHKNVVVVVVVAYPFLLFGGI